MNKNLIALAVAGAFVAPAAMAQTANPVTLYGQVNVTLESVEAKGGSAPVTRRSRVEDQSSRLGVRGTEDLGGGLKVFFQLETAFKPDQNDTDFARRNSAVGLQGGWGSLLLGRWDMPFKSAASSVDAWGNITIAGYNGVMSDQGNFDRRDQNVIQYWSPTFGGLAFKLAATSDETKTASAKPRDLGASMTFTRGPMYFFLAWEEHKDQVLGRNTAGVAAAASGTKEEGLAGGGSLAFGPVKVGAQYQEFKKSPGRTTQKAWMANVVWTAGNSQIIGQYMNSKNGRINSTDPLVASPAEPDCDSASIGYKYNFSRRTSFIAHYVKVDNSATAICNFGSNRLTLTGGQDPQGLAMGILHNF